MIEPVVKEIRVPTTPQKAFRRFTEEIDSWWPRATHSVSLDKCRTISWEGPEGSDLYEIDEDGNRHVWGVFTAWDPPKRFAMSWHPGHEPEEAQRIEVTFEKRGKETLVTLRHSDFEGLGETAQKTRDMYESGWVGVLQTYEETLG